MFADQRTFGSLAIDPLIPTPDAAPGGWGTDRPRRCPRRSRTSRAIRSIPAFRDAGLPRDARAQGLRDQARAARPDRRERRRQHLRRRVAVGRPHPSRDTARSAVDARRQPAARRGARGAREGAGRGRHELRRAVRQRQRPGRLLRALAERLRPHRPAVPALRPPDRARVVHEPVEPLLPALPASRRRPRSASRFCHSPA